MKKKTYLNPLIGSGFQEINEDVLMVVNSGQSILDPGRYILDSSLGSFTVILPKKEGVYEFYNPNGSLDTNPVTFISQNAYTFTNKNGLQIAEALVADVGKVDLTIKNIGNSDDFFVSVNSYNPVQAIASSSTGVFNNLAVASLDGFEFRASQSNLQFEMRYISGSVAIRTYNYYYRSPSFQNSSTGTRTVNSNWQPVWGDSTLSMSNEGDFEEMIFYVGSTAYTFKGVVGSVYANNTIIVERLNQRSILNPKQINVGGNSPIEGSVLRYNLGALQYEPRTFEFSSASFGAFSLASGIPQTIPIGTIIDGNIPVTNNGFDLKGGRTYEINFTIAFSNVSVGSVITMGLRTSAFIAIANGTMFFNQANNGSFPSRTVSIFYKPANDVNIIVRVDGPGSNATCTLDTNNSRITLKTID